MIRIIFFAGAALGFFSIAYDRARHSAASFKARDKLNGIRSAIVGTIMAGFGVTGTLIAGLAAYKSLGL